MKECVDVNENYKRLANQIGGMMIIEFALWFAASIINGMLSPKINAVFGKVTGEAVLDMTYGIMYIVAITVPILLFRRFSSEKMSVGISGNGIKYIAPAALVALAVIYAASYLNFTITAPLDKFGLDVYSAEENTAINPFNLAVSFVTVVIIPPIFEELLFRGTILSSLMNYGKDAAIFASAFLFGLAHQNPKQFLYAFFAGLIIGFFVSETGNLLFGIIIHMANNLLSFVNTVLCTTCDENIVNAYSLSVCIIIFAGAFISIPVIRAVAAQSKKENGEKESAEQHEKIHYVKNLSLSAVGIYFVLSAALFVWTVLKFKL